MITDSDKRQAGLSLLQRLRRQGVPREEKVESMFDSLSGGGPEDEPQDEEQPFPEYELRSPEEEAKEREKKKKPALDQKKVDLFKKGFMSVK